jgi:hypothetical protein
MLVVEFRPPELPVIVIVVVPIAAVPLVVRVNKLLLTAGLGLNPAVTPLGKPDGERVTKPFAPLITIVLVPLFPRTMVSLFGSANRVNFSITVSLTVVV